MTTTLRDIRAGKKSPSGSFFEGRGLAIAIVVLVAGACFILGYFVGRATAPASEVAAPAITPETFRSNVVVKTNEPDPLASAPSSSSSPSASGDDYSVFAQKPASEPARPSTQSSKTASAARRTEPAQTAKPAAKTEKNSHKEASAKKPASSKAQYSVQIGAFGTQEDAASLKKKFVGKGYETYVYRDTGAGGKAIYKVRIGPFKDQESAKRIALRIKASDGITAFVSEGH